ncbi:MAG: helix-turn-helix transcriptional regulator [Lachnospiraceae bacterium]|nr:helix-turn-helix transcriptional regulator [Lachnospiraceae bacterium]
MSVKDVVVARFTHICKTRGIAINELATRSGVTPSTAYSMFDKKRQDVSIVTIKKFCDGLDISLREFFDSDEFDNLEQEIR